MARWFTSDLHLSHARILEFEPRGHSDVPEMNTSVLATINSTVQPDDELWLVGDLAMGPIEESLAQIETIAARVVIVAGNHDRCHPSNRKADRWLARYENLSNVVAVHPTSATVDLDGLGSVLVCHFPYPPDARPVTHRDGSVTPDRFADYRPVDNGEWLIHGHVHSQWRQNGKQINVGVDAWGGALVSEQQVCELIRSGPAFLEAVKWPTRQVRVTSPTVTTAAAAQLRSL